MASEHGKKAPQEVTLVKPPFHTQFSPRVRKGLKFTPGSGRTKQEFKKDCDINYIIKRYHKTGILPQDTRDVAKQFFGDFTNVPAIEDMYATINAAESVFAALPAAVRKVYENDPRKFLKAAETKEGRELMAKLGLGPEANQAPPSPTPPGQPAPTPPAPGGAPIPPPSGGEK